MMSVLRKTIVFITHDFDEAIRLADRIAIMKDGEVIQIGTPEELVRASADDYVQEFAKDIPRAKVLSARSVMEPLTGTESDAVEVAKLEDLAARLPDGGKEVGLPIFSPNCSLSPGHRRAPGAVSMTGCETGSLTQLGSGALSEPPPTCRPAS